MKLALFLIAMGLLSLAVVFYAELFLKWLSDRRREKAIKDILYDFAKFKVKIGKDGRKKLYFDGKVFDL